MLNWVQREDKGLEELVNKIYCNETIYCWKEMYGRFTVERKCTAVSWKEMYGSELNDGKGKNEDDAGMYWNVRMLNKSKHG